MKILFVGATGSIGRCVLRQCLACPSVTAVVAFNRRELPADIPRSPKLGSVIIEDFARWPEELLQKHADAVGMIWAMGTYTGSLTADLEYPLAFVSSTEAVLSRQPKRVPFRYVHLSGKFVRQDQDRPLWFLEKPRKLKGLLETRALQFADEHPQTWKTFIVKPGMVATRAASVQAILAPLMPIEWAVRADELGAFMTYLAVGDGDQEELVTQNGRLVEKGRALLKTS